jgi:hypothetical protein
VVWFRTLKQFFAYDSSLKINWAVNLWKKKLANKTCFPLQVYLRKHKTGEIATWYTERSKCTYDNFIFSTVSRREKRTRIRKKCPKWNFNQKASKYTLYINTVLRHPLISDWRLPLSTVLQCNVSRSLITIRLFFVLLYFYLYMFRSV